mmetsp:Transcript_4340/g.4797  ORF Transcript_4340/g.4797 Transcript_4340/m.4797 type:complete len:426 (+) Transcript_4340:175-1452(+)|eukprot:CAMPEP_0194147740 /NCGR_PEP_ID=MMETSP0152-20130528/27435_1 /TAXON_ID=1049557 /ORGANISM="Thalassiothrix antarctica, Strain L6-D1" /LENGTH=425 /DNA_ID=CAMNT_0038848771 /DNA_START=130 /DNA_END=1407 /DNA_ORIENTATION=+
MSGYRSLHREQIFLEGGGSSGDNDVVANDNDEVPIIWELQCTAKASSLLESSSRSNSTSSSSILLTASADSFIRLYSIREKDSATSYDDLNASTMKIYCTHILLGINNIYPAANNNRTLLGCSQCEMIRNYVGSDDMAGDIVIVGLEFTGRIRVWSFDLEEFQLEEKESGLEPKQIRSKFEFVTKRATGTMMAVCPSYVEGDLTTAVACLDGSIVIVALGIGTPNMKKEATLAGTILYSLGSIGSIALSIRWHPSEPILAVGRIDGIVDIIPVTATTNQQQKKGLIKQNRRITHHSKPVRAVSFTKDGTMLITGSDDGFLAVWDLQRNNSTAMMVHHVVQAHFGWIIGITALNSDSRRFITAGADKKIHVWQFDQMQYAPTHTFQSDGDVRTICTTAIAASHTTTTSERLFSASGEGWIQVFSLD